MNDLVIKPDSLLGLAIWKHNDLWDKEMKHSKEVEDFIIASICAKARNVWTK